MHATKYQTIVLSNFMIAHYNGPHPGSFGDANVLGRSKIQERLRTIAKENGIQVSLYGDGAYPLSDVLHRSYKGQINSKQAALNEEMRSYCQEVEWIFRKVETTLAACW